MDLRERLIDFAIYFDGGNTRSNRKAYEMEVDIYLKSINRDLDETQTVRQNEQTKEFCPECKSTEFHPYEDDYYECNKCANMWAK